jgi:hypothetical protein
VWEQREAKWKERFVEQEQMWKAKVGRPAGEKEAGRERAEGRGRG